MAKRGRPKREIDWAKVEGLARFHCTPEEIANFMEIPPRTLTGRDEFSQIYKKGIDAGKMSLRRWQFKSAENGNVTMQIWLGKQLLGQTDKSDCNLKVTKNLKYTGKDPEAYITNALSKNES